jgi:regulator of sigma E protease
MTTVLAFLVAIGVLVAVHEYGHFWMARRVGIRVLRFSIGFGRPLLKRRGADGTEYVLAAIPLGGYVKLLDEREGPVPAAEAANAYNRKPVWQRVLVLLAGPFANFVFAVLAYWVLFTAGIPALKPVLGEITAGSIAAQAGLAPGDEIVSVGSQATPTREAAVLTILDQMMNGNPIPLSVRDRAGSERHTELRIGGRTRALTEPGALLPGLGFDFWYPDVPAVVGTADEGTPAREAGLQSGDRIVAVDGRPIADFKGLVEQVQPNPGKSLMFRIERAGREFDVRIEVEAQRDGEREVGRIGVHPASVSEIPPAMRTSERYAPLSALAHATTKTWDMSALTARMLWNVVTGDVSVKNLSGPINIAEYAGTSARQGVLAFLSFLAIVSVSLFVLNLLPIPILDGGQIVYQLAELAKGSPLSERTQAVGQQIGIVLLLVLMSFAFYNDLSRLFS